MKKEIVNKKKESFNKNERSKSKLMANQKARRKENKNKRIYDDVED